MPKSTNKEEKKRIEKICGQYVASNHGEDIYCSNEAPCKVHSPKPSPIKFGKWEKIIDQELAHLVLATDWSEDAKKIFTVKQLELQTAQNDGWNNALKVVAISLGELIEQVESQAYERGFNDCERAVDKLCKVTKKK